MVHRVEPITSVTRRDAVLTELRDAILTRRLAPGDRLRELQLAKDLGVSRPTLREAIYQLIHEGLLVQEAYKGVAVATWDRQTILDISVVRTALESIAAKALASAVGEAERDALREAMADYEKAAARGDPSEENEAHLHLHETIWMQSGNNMLHRIWPIVSAPVRQALSVDLAFHSGATERNVRMHRELVEAILSNEVVTIETTVREHIETSAAQLLAGLPPDPDSE